MLLCLFHFAISTFNRMPEFVTRATDVPKKQSLFWLRASATEGKANKLGEGGDREGDERQADRREGLCMMCMQPDKSILLEMVLVSDSAGEGGG